MVPEGSETQRKKGTVKILPSGIPENNAAVPGEAALSWNELLN